MDIAAGMVQTEVSAEDVLAAAGMVPANNVKTSSLNGHWTKPAKYLEWATRGFREADQHGLANAITYAKLATCCRVDRLINNYHLRRLHRLVFPEKIDALKRVGINIPSVVHELIITPRNELEHDYAPADLDTARRAVDIATLFLTATDSDEREESIVMLNMNMRASSAGGERVTFNGWCPRTMLFVDIFAEPQAAKIVDGEQRQVSYSELTKFTRQQAIELARILHGHYSLQNRSSGSGSRFFYTEIKRLSGL